MERLCTACGTVIHGRTDKKFCDDQCRSSFNNIARHANNEVINKVNRILRKNRQILEHLNPEGKVKISYSELIQAGYSLEYHTHTYLTQNGSFYYFCYDYGYIKIAPDRVLLVKSNTL